MEVMDYGIYEASNPIEVVRPCPPVQIAVVLKRAPQIGSIRLMEY